MIKVLVTGCNGQVGSCLVKQLQGKAEVLAVDRQQLDITQQQKVINAVADFKPDYIINAAAHTAVDKAEEEIEVSYAINRDGPKFLAQAAQKHNAVILHISTDYVFDGKGVSAYREVDATKPQSVYGESKLAGEQAVASCCDNHLILRTAWVFGEYGNNFVKTMLRLAEDRDELSIVGDQFGGPTFAGDIASALIRMIEAIESGDDIDWGVYHFSGMPYVSWFEFAEQIFSVADKNALLNKPMILHSIPSTAYPTPATRPENSRMDCSKIKLKFNIEPSDWKLALKNIQAYK